MIANASKVLGAPRRESSRAVPLVCLCAATLSVGPRVSPADAQCQGAWVQTPAAGPSPRAGHAMAFDAARGVAMLHGGMREGGVALSDTWVWNGSSWSLAATLGPSPARANSGIAYDAARSLVVLFGGEVNLACNIPARYFGDTWTWNGSAWTLAASSGAPSRGGPAMCDDPTRARVVLYAGLSDCGAGRSDTWEWDGLQWSDRLASQPGAHREPAAWFDATAGRVRIFGGFNGLYLADMWEWSGTFWSQIPHSGPVGRHHHALASEDGAARMILFGGNNASGNLADTWLFNGSTWSQHTGPGPAARHSHTMVHDPVRRQVVLFGGTGAAGPLGDTWIWSSLPVIVSQPAPVLICPLTPSSFNSSAAGSGPFTYQWQLEDASAPAGWRTLADGPLVINAVIWGTIGGATSATLNATPDPQNYTIAPTLRFRCVVTNACGSVTSNPATLTVCPADWNCDGVVDFNDFLSFLNDYNAGLPIADLNGDGVVDFNDFLEFLNIYNAPC